MLTYDATFFVRHKLKAVFKHITTGVIPVFSLKTAFIMIYYCSRLTFLLVFFSQLTVGIPSLGIIGCLIVASKEDFPCPVIIPFVHKDCHSIHGGISTHYLTAKDGGDALCLQSSLKQVCLKRIIAGHK